MTLTFHPTIYPQHETPVIPLNGFFDAATWPKKVNVLAEHDLDRSLSSPFCKKGIHSLSLRSIWGAAVNEFTLARIPERVAAPRLLYWWKMHERIITYLIGMQRWRGEQAFAYNASWAMMGYIVGQSDEVLDFIHEIHSGQSFKHASLILQNNKEGILHS